MKRSMVLILAFFLMFVSLSWTLADEDSKDGIEAVSISFGGLLHNQPVELVNRDGIIITAIKLSEIEDSVYYDGRYFEMILEITNDNDFTVGIDFYSSNTGRYGDLLINGEKFSYRIKKAFNISFDESVYAEIIAEAKSHNVLYRMTISRSTKDGAALPALEDVTDGELSICAYLPTEEDLANPNFYAGIREKLFILPSVTFDMEYAEAPVYGKEDVPDTGKNEASTEAHINLNQLYENDERPLIANQNGIKIWLEGIAHTNDSYDQKYETYVYFTIENSTDSDWDVYIPVDIDNRKDMAYINGNEDGNYASIIHILTESGYAEANSTSRGYIQFWCYGDHDPLPEEITSVAFKLSADVMITQEKMADLSAAQYLNLVQNSSISFTEESIITIYIDGKKEEGYLPAEMEKLDPWVEADRPGTVLLADLDGIKFYDYGFYYAPRPYSSININMLMDGSIPESTTLYAENVLVNNKECKVRLHQYTTYDHTYTHEVMINSVAIESNSFIGNLPLFPEITSASFALVLKDAEENELARSEIITYTFEDGKANEP